MLAPTPPAKEKAKYGWDAPGVMLGMLAVGAGLVAVGMALVMLISSALSEAVGIVVIVAGAVPLMLGLAMLQYGLVGKIRTRDAILGLATWRGDETVLDVGTGAAMLMIGAAKRLTRGGRAVGVDTWSAKDLSDNSIASTRRNIAIEGVADRTEVLTDDATRLSFPDATLVDGR
jgi:hypothetical protein